MIITDCFLRCFDETLWDVIWAPSEMNGTDAGKVEDSIKGMVMDLVLSLASIEPFPCVVGDGTAAHRFNTVSVRVWASGVLARAAHRYRKAFTAGDA